MSDEHECSAKGGKIIHTFRLKFSARGIYIFIHLYLVCSVKRRLNYSHIIINNCDTSASCLQN